jgi:hypothetical protein
MHTIEIAGRPIAIANVGLQDEAEELFNSDEFKNDLMIFETEDGDALWNGSDPFFIRPAFPEEVANFEPVYAKALRSGDAEEGGPYLVFLIPVTNATDELD